MTKRQAATLTYKHVIQKLKLKENPDSKIKKKIKEKSKDKKQGKYLLYMVSGGYNDSNVVSDSVYLQHNLAVMHVRLPEPQLQQLHVPNLPANTR